MADRGGEDKEKKIEQRWRLERAIKAPVCVNVCV